MPRANVRLLLDSAGYGINNLGPQFLLSVSTSLGGPVVELMKDVPFGTTTTFKRKPVLIDRVVDVPAGTSAVKLHVDAVEGKEKHPDPGMGNGSVAFKLDGTCGAVVSVKVEGRGREKGKRAELNLGFLLVTDSAPERIAALCALLRGTLPVFAAGTPEEALRTMLLRIAWHESGGLRNRVQTDGPALGLYQMQRGAAVAALDALKSSNRPAYEAFAAADDFSGIANLDAELDKLRGMQGPDFGDNAIGRALVNSDRCATLAALGFIRGALGDLPQPGDVAGAGEFWEDHWHVAPNATLRTAFVDHAKELDKLRAQLIGSDCGTKQ